MTRVFIIDTLEKNDRETKIKFIQRDAFLKNRGYIGVNPFSLHCYNDWEKTEPHLLFNCHSIALFCKISEIQNNDYFIQCLKKGLKSGLALISTKYEPRNREVYTKARNRKTRTV